MNVKPSKLTNIFILVIQSVFFIFSNGLDASTINSNTCLEKFAFKNGAKDPSFELSTLKAIEHDDSKQVFGFDPKKIQDFNLPKESIQKFPLFHLLVKPGHILARDYRYMISLKNRLLHKDKSLDLAGKEPMELMVYLDKAEIIQRVELIGGHHRMYAIYSYLKEIGSSPTLYSVLKLNQKAIDIQYMKTEENYPLSKLPLHGVVLGNYQGSIVEYHSEKAPTIKVAASNYVAGSRTLLGIAAKFSLRKKNQHKRVAFYIFDEHTNMTDLELEISLELLELKAFTNRYKEIIIVCINNENLKQKIAGSKLKGYQHLNLYMDHLGNEKEYLQRTDGNNLRLLKLLELRLQQLYQTYNVFDISNFDL